MNPRDAGLIIHVFCNVATKMMTPAQCRAARALLDWSRQDLARASRVAERTIIDFERGARTPYERTLRDLRGAFEAAGVSFVEDGDGQAGAGVRFSQQGSASTVTEIADEADDTGRSDRNR